MCLHSHIMGSRLPYQSLIFRLKTWFNFRGRLRLCSVSSGSGKSPGNACKSTSCPPRSDGNTLCMYLDDHAHNRQREDSSRVGRRPAIYVITSCQSNPQTTIRIHFAQIKAFTNVTVSEWVNTVHVHSAASLFSTPIWSNFCEVMFIYRDNKDSGFVETERCWVRRADIFSNLYLQISLQEKTRDGCISPHRSFEFSLSSFLPPPQNNRGELNFICAAHRF